MNIIKKFPELLRGKNFAKKHIIILIERVKVKIKNYNIKIQRLDV